MIERQQTYQKIALSQAELGFLNFEEFKTVGDKYDPNPHWDSTILGMLNHYGWKSALSRPDIQEATLLVGLPGSGRSSWVRDYQKPNVAYLEVPMYTAKDRARYIAMALRNTKQVSAVFFDIPLQTILERNHAKDRGYSEVQLTEWHNQLQADPPSSREMIDQVIHYIG